MDAEEARVLGGIVSEAGEENRMLASWSGGSGGTEDGSPVLRFFGPRRTGTDSAVSGKLSDTAAGVGTVSEAAEQDRMLGFWSAGSGGTDEGSPVLRFFGPRRIALSVVSSGCLVSSEAVASCAGSGVLLSFGSGLDEDEAAVLGAVPHEAEAGEHFPVTRLRGPDEAARAAPLEDRLMGPETVPRRGAVLWGSGPKGVK